MIILDTNVLPRHGSLGGPTVALVRAIAQKTGQEVALPAMVVEESVAELDRELSKHWEKAKAAAEALATFFPGYRIDQPDLAKRVEQWRGELEQSFTILDSSHGTANEALRREAHRIPPTRPAGAKGSGARDALIWLTVLEAYRQEPAAGAIYFVTNNSTDFGRDNLLPALQREVDGVATTASFHYLNSMTDLLEQLAVPAGPGPTRAELLASDTMLDAAEAALFSLDVIAPDDWQRPTSLTNWGQAWPLRGEAGPLIAMLTLREAEAGKVYQVGGQRFAAVSTVWGGLAVTGAISSTGVSEQYVHRYTARLLILVELEDDGRVMAADVVGTEPFVYDGTDIERHAPG